MSLNSTVDAVTDRIRERSRAGREAYLDRCRAAAARKPRRGTLSCGNLAHGFAVCGASSYRIWLGQPRPTSPSSRPTTTCCRPTSRSKPFRR